MYFNKQIFLIFRNYIFVRLTYNNLNAYKSWPWSYSCCHFRTRNALFITEHERVIMSRTDLSTAHSSRRQSGTLDRHVVSGSRLLLVYRYYNFDCETSHVDTITCMYTSICGTRATPRNAFAPDRRVMCTGNNCEIRVRITANRVIQLTGNAVPRWNG